MGSTATSLGDGTSRHSLTARQPKRVWSALNKRHSEVLSAIDLMHNSRRNASELGKENGSWTALDDVENCVIPEDLDKAFKQNKLAFKNYEAFSPSQQKSYLYWLTQAKREETRQKRIAEIVSLCKSNIKSRGW